MVLRESANSLLAGAREIAASLSVLADHTEPIPPRGPALLAAHSLELALKAFLLSQKWPAEKVKDLGHNVAKAWVAAAQAGLGVAVDPPSWCLQLQSLHDSPYYLRYPPENSGLVTPGLIELRKQVSEVLERVTIFVKAA